MSAEFFSALAAIVLIDLVLAGDNAIVIALAARNLPVGLRTRAVVWGTVGAIVVRTGMTLGVVWLLGIPGLLAAGGALLLWIACKLLVDQNGGDPGIASSRSFWGAMKTIVVADAVMGLDNVLAVAGAAHGSFLLVALGLLISIPIVIWGSQMILKFVERFPAIVYAGAAVLAWTGAKMLLGEPLVREHVLIAGDYAGWITVAVVGGVLGAGFWTNHRPARARVTAHVVDLAEATSQLSVNLNGGGEMKRVLIPVDGSDSAMQAVRHVVNRFLDDSAMEVHLLHVRQPLSQHVARFVSKRDREAFHRDRAGKALSAARDLLSRHGVPYATHVELGDAAATIDRVAQRLRVSQIVIGTARKNSLTRLVQDSVTGKVLELARVPVEVVAGGPVSRWERIGIPAGIGIALAMAIAAFD